MEIFILKQFLKIQTHLCWEFRVTVPKNYFDVLKMWRQQYS